MVAVSALTGTESVHPQVSLIWKRYGYLGNMVLAAKVLS